MNKAEVEFECRCTVKYKHVENKELEPLSVKLGLIVDKKIKESSCLDESGKLKDLGMKIFVRNFICGMIGIMNQAHHSGFYDADSHLEFIVEELKDGVDKIKNNNVIVD